MEEVDHSVDVNVTENISSDPPAIGEEEEETNKPADNCEVDPPLSVPDNTAPLPIVDVTCEVEGDCEVSPTEEPQSREEVINNLLIENEALKQENHELRLRIEQLENMHVASPQVSAPSATRTSTSGSKSQKGKPAATSTSTPVSTDPNSKKPELDVTVATLRSMPCLSADVWRFFECFEKYSHDNDSSKAFRKAQWAALDSNGSGHVSLAETARWIKASLYQMTKNRDEGERIYRHYYPCYIRAFTDAADAGVDKKIKGMKAVEDDFIQKGEFRLLASYLCIYALMLDTFNVLDGSRSGSAAPATAPASVFRADKKAKSPPKQAAGRGSSAPAIATISGDRRISQEEWNERYLTLGSTPFVALNTIAHSPELAQAAFSEMDADGKGAVLFAEYCQWLKNKEIAETTSFGRLLSVGDNVK